MLTKRTYIATALLALTGVVTSAIIVNTLWGQRHNHSKLYREEKHPVHKQGSISDFCDTVSKVQVCAHRGNASEYVNRQHVAQSHTNGLLQHLKLLAQQGVTCVDLDVFLTDSGLLHVGHPAEVQAYAERDGHLPVQTQLDTAQGVPAHILSSKEAQQRFPALSDVMQTFAEVMPATHVPMRKLLLELKGRTQTTENLLVICKEAARMGLQNAIAMWCSEETCLNDIQAVRSIGCKLLSIRTVRDQHVVQSRAETSNKVDIAKVLENYDYLGPSIKIESPHLYQSAATAGKGSAVWTVDDEASLVKALKVSADVVITNKPMATQDLLRKWRQSCIQRQSIA